MAHTFPCGCFLPAHGACLVSWREKSHTCNRCGTTTVAVTSYLREQDAAQNRYTLRVRIFQTILIMFALSILIYCVVHYLFKL
jgi:hypothetical protein